MIQSVEQHIPRFKCSQTQAIRFCGLFLAVCVPQQPILAIIYGAPYSARRETFATDHPIWARTATCVHLRILTAQTERSYKLGDVVCTQTRTTQKSACACRVSQHLNRLRPVQCGAAYTLHMTSIGNAPYIAVLVYFRLFTVFRFQF